MATEKQVRYIMALLRQAGYDTRWMGSEFKALGAKMNERRGSVEGWVRNLDRGRASDVIDMLLEEAA